VEKIIINKRQPILNRTHTDVSDVKARIGYIRGIFTQEAKDWAARRGFKV
jgi:hypothetical protein